jgi:hypothetical protein
MSSMDGQPSQDVPSRNQIQAWHAALAHFSPHSPSVDRDDSNQHHDRLGSPPSVEFTCDCGTRSATHFVRNGYVAFVSRSYAVLSISKTRYGGSVFGSASIRRLISSTGIARPGAP